ncbi:MAG: hypothetical protein GEU71_09360 [Actinobacteria bacterium]|nr:hypothetical protein [Actinomycetota bacterium]
MSGFSAVPPSMYDPAFTALSESAQRLEFYIRTCPQRNSEGLSRMRWGAVEDDLGMPRDVARTALNELLRAGRPFVYDDRAEVILDKDALRTQPIGRKNVDPDAWDKDAKHDNRLKAAVARINDLPRSRELLKHLYIVAESYAPEFARLLAEEFTDITEPLSEPLLKPLSKGRVEQSREEESRDERAS